MKKITDKQSFNCDCGCGKKHFLGGIYIGEGFGYQIKTLLKNSNVIVPIKDDFYKGETILDLPSSSIYQIESELEKSEITNGIFVAIAENEKNEIFLIYAANNSKEVNPRMNEPHKLYLIPFKNYGNYITSGGIITEFI